MISFSAIKHSSGGDIDLADGVKFLGKRSRLFFHSQ